MFLLRQRQALNHLTDLDQMVLGTPPTSNLIVYFAAHFQ